MADTLSRGPVTGTAAGSSRKRRPFLLDLYSTAVGKKYAMAITGLIGIGFVVFHMLGNLKMYIGTVEHDGQRVYDIDLYAEFLRNLLVPLAPRTYVLWGLRIVLIAAVLIHIHAAYGLTVINRKARAVKYQSKRDYEVANFASRTMRWTGIIVALFLVWHLADLTWGWANPGFERGEVYRNVEASMSRVPVAMIYIVANLALGVHLFHGTWSLFQSMGWNNPRFNRWRKGIAVGIAGAVVLGNISFPVAVMAGIIQAPTG